MRALSDMALKKQEKRGKQRDERLSEMAKKFKPSKGNAKLEFGSSRPSRRELETTLNELCKAVHSEKRNEWLAKWKFDVETDKFVGEK